MGRSTVYTYDSTTGKWTTSTSDDGSSNSNNNNQNGGNSDGGDNLTTTTSDGESGTGGVEKEYNDIEINTLEGTLTYIVTKETIKLKAGDTVSLKGLGKYLSGKYYVKEVTRSISSSGYSHTAVVIKTDFGKSLKVKSTNTNTNETKVPSPPTSDDAKRTHTVVTGECLWNIAIQYYGDGSKYTKIYDANTDKIANPDLIYVGQVLVIP